MKLALFDFDGTISYKDSMLDFIQYAVGKPSFYWGLLLLSPMLAAYKLKLIPNDIAKEKLITHFFAGWHYSQFNEVASNYSRERIKKIIRPNMLEKIRWHQQQKHDVVVVSASMESWLKYWCKEQGIDLIATQLEIIDGKITGKFAGKNCHGVEKVNRIKQQYSLSAYKTIYAYGDSSGDKAMLAIADIPYYKGEAVYK